MYYITNIVPKLDAENPDHSEDPEDSEDPEGPDWGSRLMKYANKTTLMVNDQDTSLFKQYDVKPWDTLSHKYYGTCSIVNTVITFCVLWSSALGVLGRVAISSSVPCQRVAIIITVSSMFLDVLRSLLRRP